MPKTLVITPPPSARSSAIVGVTTRICATPYVSRSAACSQQLGFARPVLTRSAGLPHLSIRSRKRTALMQFSFGSSQTSGHTCVTTLLVVSTIDAGAAGFASRIPAMPRPRAALIEGVSARLEKGRAFARPRLIVRLSPPADVAGVLEVRHRGSVAFNERIR